MYACLCTHTYLGGLFVRQYRLVLLLNEELVLHKVHKLLPRQFTIAIRVKHTKTDCKEEEMANTYVQRNYNIIKRPCLHMYHSYIRTCTYVHKCLYICTYTYIHTVCTYYIYMHVYTYVCTYMCIHIYVHTYVYIHIQYVRMYTLIVCLEVYRQVCAYCTQQPCCVYVHTYVYTVDTH